MRTLTAFLCAIALLSGDRAPAQTNRWLDLMSQGTVLNDSGDYAAAAAAFRGAVHEAEASGGGQLVSALNALGSVTEEMGQFLAAGSLYRRAAELSRDNPELRRGYAQSLGNLAGNYVETGDLVKAAGPTRESLAILTALEPADSLELALARSALGNLLFLGGSFDEAEQLIEQALATFRKHPDPLRDHEMAGLNNLGVVRSHQGRKQEAAMLFTEASRLAEAGLGPEHPLLLRTLENLASTEAELGNYLEADAHFQRAVQLAEKFLGKTHPVYGRVLMKYAGLLNLTGHRSAARKAQAEAKSVLHDSADINGTGMTIDVSAFRH